MYIYVYQQGGKVDMIIAFGRKKNVYEEIVVFCSLVLANFACTSLSSMGGSNGIGSRHRSAVATITCAQRIEKSNRHRR
jgi:hypothetical protein